MISTYRSLGHQRSKKGKKMSENVSLPSPSPGKEEDNRQEPEKKSKAGHLHLQPRRKKSSSKESLNSPTPFMQRGRPSHKKEGTPHSQLYNKETSTSEEKSEEL